MFLFLWSFAVLIILCLVYIVLAFLSIFLPLWVIFGAVNEGTTGPDWELLYAGLIWWCQDTDCSRNGASRDEDAMQTLPARLFTGLFLAGGILCSLLLGLLLFNRKKVASFVVAFLRCKCSSNFLQRSVLALDEYL